MGENGELSGLSVTSTGSPQGCVLSPLLYIMHTNNYRGTYEAIILGSLRTDTAISSILNRERFSCGSVVVKNCFDR